MLLICAAVLLLPSVLSEAKDSGYLENDCCLDSDIGLCLALMKRYHYNRHTSKCEQFNYGGCWGNNNRFMKLEDCERRCKNVRCGDRHQDRAEIENKEKPQDRGEMRNKEKAQDRDCCLDSDIGLCLALMKRYHYNRHTSKCEQFNYGGCRGNNNRFMKVEDCERRCKNVRCGDRRQDRAEIENKENRQDRAEMKTKEKHQDRDCCLDSDIGLCLALMKRYHYNRHTSKCEEFNYGGCRGNNNRFMKLDDCERRCKNVRCGDRRQDRAEIENKEKPQDRDTIKTKENPLHPKATNRKPT